MSANSITLQRPETAEFGLHYKNIGMLLGSLITKRSARVALTHHGQARKIKNDLQYIRPYADLPKPYYLEIASRESLKAEAETIRTVKSYATKHGKDGLIIIEGIDFNSTNDNKRPQLAGYLGHIMNAQNMPMQLVLGTGTGVSRETNPTDVISSTQAYLSNVVESYRLNSGNDWLNAIDHENASLPKPLVPARLANFDGVVDVETYAGAIRLGM